VKEELKIYKGKRVLVTGHTGFKGSWLSIWLKELGAEVIGYALEPYTTADNFMVCNLAKKITDIRGDIRDYARLTTVFKKYSPQIVFHLAAQSLVIDGYDMPKETFDINIGGTVNVLENCRILKSVKVVINVTSDKCYKNKEQIRGYKETDALGGSDPYSASKACSEMVTAAYRDTFLSVKDFAKHGKALSTVRAGNVIGGGDWRKDRIIPDCIKSLEKNEPIQIRNPNSLRPWQYVLEPLGGYLLLAGKMYENSVKYCGAWNFGPNRASFITVKELVNLLMHEFGRGSWKKSSHQRPVHETKYLTLNITKAKNILGWQPCISIDEAMKKTVEWYKNYKSTRDMYNFCRSQINEYMKEWDRNETH
jgi:CDP-glucose 4,6-dehydratase